MQHEETTNYAVRLERADGYYPDGEIEPLDWLSLAASKRIAGAVWGAAQGNENVIAVEIIDAGYTVVQRELVH